MIAWDSFIVDTVLLRRLYVQKTLAIWPRDSGIRTRYPLMAAMPPNLVSRRRARVRPQGFQPISLAAISHCQMVVLVPSQ